MEPEQLDDWLARITYALEALAALGTLFAEQRGCYPPLEPRDRELLVYTIDNFLDEQDGNTGKPEAVGEHGT